MDLKFLLCLVGYQRPNLLRMPLTSIRDQSYTNWHCAFIDDASTPPLRPIVEDVLRDHLDKVTFYRCEDTAEQKHAQGGSRHGQYMNDAIHKHEADICFPVCDDDALLPDYLLHLNTWYKENPGAMYSYSHSVPFNPFVEAPGPQCYGRHFPWNHTQPVAPSCAVDSTQVTYRRECFTTTDIHYPIGTRNLDCSIYSQLYEHFGLCHFNGLQGQFKGMYPTQLTYRDDSTAYSPPDTNIIV